MPVLKRQNPVAANAAAVYMVALKPKSSEIIPPINAPATAARLITELSIPVQVAFSTLRRIR